MFATKKTDFINVGTLCKSLIQDLVDNGFTIIYNKSEVSEAFISPNEEIFPSLPAAFAIDAILESSSTMVLGEEPWRIRFYGTDNEGLSKTDVRWPRASFYVLTSVMNTIDVTDIRAVSNLQAPDLLSSNEWISRPAQERNTYTRIDGFSNTISLPTTPVNLNIMVGSRLQIVPIISFRTTEYASSYSAIEPWGNICGAEWKKETPTPNTPSHFFYYRGDLINDTDRSAEDGVPMSYYLSITNRGIFIGVWESRTVETGQKFSWLVVQRSVIKETGAIRGVNNPNSTSPVFCIFSCPDSLTSETFGKIIVRERDIDACSKRYILKKSNGLFTDSEDHPAFLNPCKQVSFSEDGNYIVSFLNNLTTPRFRYPDELDMVATIGADVVGFGHELQFSVYNEAAPRTYIALLANEPFNTGMRLLVLKDNPNE